MSNPHAWAEEQAALFVRTHGAEGNTLQGKPIVVVTTTGAKSGTPRLVPVMRVEHGGSYAVVASKGGAPRNPVWYNNLVVNPKVQLQDGPTKHDYVARELAVTQIRAETLEQVARIFLTLRDRSNTPIQTLESAAELLRRQYPEAERLSEVIQRASARLSETSDLLTRLESQVSWSGDELMSDEEIRGWLDRMEHPDRGASEHPPGYRSR